MDDGKATSATALSSAIVSLVIALICFLVPDALAWAHIGRVYRLILGVLALSGLVLGIYVLARPVQNQRRIAVVFGFLGLLIGGVLVTGLLRDSGIADVRWAARSADGQLVIEQSPILRVRDDWIHGDAAKVPVRLAFANKSDQPLSEVRVQIHYPAGYRITPHGDQRGDPENRTIVIEHPVDDLFENGAYVYLAEPDTLILAVKQIRKRLVVPDLVPLETIATITLVGGKQAEVNRCLFVTEVPLQVAIFNGGQRIAESELRLKTDSMGRQQFQDAGPQRRIRPTDLSAAERQVIDDGFASTAWQWVERPGGAWGASTVRYGEGNEGGASYQFIEVGLEGRVVSRTVIADMDGDKSRDLEAISSSATKSHFIGRYRKDVPFDAWQPADLKPVQTEPGCR